MLDAGEVEANVGVQDAAGLKVVREDCGILTLALTKHLDGQLAALGVNVSEV